MQISLIICVTRTFYLSTGSRGYEFMFMFMENLRPYVDLGMHNRFAQIYLAADADATLTVSTSPRLNSSIKGFVDRNTIPITKGLNILNITGLIRLSEDQVLEHKGILVTSTKLVTLFALNHEMYASDSMLVLPVDRLGKTYFVPSTQPFDSVREDYHSQFAFVATEDQTDVEIKLKLRDSTQVTYQGTQYGDGGTFTVSNMKKSDTFQVAHGSDLTGTIIKATKPVGVIAGNRCNKLRSSFGGHCSHLVEMIPPVESWDTTYIVPPHYDHEGSLVRILASQNTSVDITMGTTGNKNLGISDYTDKEPDGSTPVVIEASKPVEVMSFAKGKGYFFPQPTKDPYFTMIQGIHQYVHEYRFAVPQHFNTSYITGNITFQQHILCRQAFITTPYSQVQYTPPYPQLSLPFPLLPPTSPFTIEHHFSYEHHYFFAR